MEHDDWNKFSRQKFRMYTNWWTAATFLLTRIYNYLCVNIIPHLHNLILYQCDVTWSLNRYEARSELFIDQGRTTLYRLLRYIGQYRFNVVLSWVDCYNAHHTTHVTDV